MIAPDTSVLVAAFASWHESHVMARAVLGGARPVGHCLVETYSVLTRLPPPHRVPAALAADFLTGVTTSAPLALPAEDLPALAQELAAAGVSGGAAYDALIAVTARHHGAELVSLDGRAATTYRLFGVPYRLLA